MEHVSAPLSRVIASLNPHTQTPVYSASGRRVLRRSPEPRWLDLDEARRELFVIAAAAGRADDPGATAIPLFSQLAWAIRDASDDGSDPTPPAADAMAVPTQVAA